MSAKNSIKGTSVKDNSVKGISTEYFTHNARSKAFVIEKSTLKHLPKYKYVLTKLTIPLRSTRTGKIATFQFDKHIIYNDGELIYTKYTPTAYTERTYPGLKGYEIAVLND